MKIESRGPVRSAPVKKGEKSKSSGASGQFSQHLVDEVEGAHGVAPAGPVQSVDAVLTIQNVGDEGSAREKARRWGDATLDELEQIRVDLLLGAIPKGRLINLARMVQARRQQTDDAELNAILDEIELRVRVEIAKYEPRS